MKNLYKSIRILQPSRARKFSINTINYLKKINYDPSKGALPPKGDPSWDFYEFDSNNQYNEWSLTKENVEEEPRGSYEANFSKFGDRQVTLPKQLKSAIENTLKDSSNSELRENALKIFTSYYSLNGHITQKPTLQHKDARKIKKRPELNITKPHVLSYNKSESLAYLASIMPSYYSCLHRVLAEIKVRVPTFQPKNLLDFGTGPGTGLWAAREIFENQIDFFHGVDLSSDMLDVAEELIKTYKEPFDTKVQFERHLSYTSNPIQFNLVLACYSLSELPNDALRQKTLKDLYERCSDILVVIERGTPKGFEIINLVREMAIQLNKAEDKEQVHVMAPCPHTNKCPMQGSTKWCHFEQSVQRPKFTMQAKNSKSNIEHSNYTYIVLRKGERPSKFDNATKDEQYLNNTFHWGRVLDRPNKRGGHVNVNLCLDEAKVVKSVFTKSQGKLVYRDARKVQRGDLFPHSPKKESEPMDFSRFKKEDKIDEEDRP